MKYDLQTSCRNLTLLDGKWDFSLQEDFSNKEVMIVPGCWDASFKFQRYRGRAFYRKSIKLRDSGNYRLVFDGVANSAKVILDGKEICDHYGAHTRFRTEICFLDAGTHDLMLEVENAFGEHNSMMEEKCGWYCFGGIHRSVWMEKLPELFIDSVKIDTHIESDDLAYVNLTAVLRNLSNETLHDCIKLEIDSNIMAEQSVTLKENETLTVELSVKMRRPELWSPAHPRLYDAVLTTSMDDYRSRFGIRSIECRNGKILLNSEPLFIKGINHHDYQPLTGYTQTQAQMKYDLDIIKNMGCNLVRTSHYPKDSAFLDLCDELGIMVWTEATGWQNTPEVLNGKYFEEQCITCIDEMIGEQYNHPSIIIWGLLNEVRSEFDEIRPVMSKVIGRIRELDSSRPVTFATNRLLHLKDRMLDLVDIISPNIYTGWYSEFYGSDVNHMTEQEYFNDLLAWLDEEGLSEKPVLVGEFGAGGLSGFHSFCGERWSEERQEEIIAKALEAYTSHERCAGAIVWLFCDTLCCETEELYRPYSHNSKGVVDAFRRPKLAYRAVKQYYNLVDK